MGPFVEVCVWANVVPVIPTEVSRFYARDAAEGPAVRLPVLATSSAASCNSGASPAFVSPSSPGTPARNRSRSSQTSNRHTVSIEKSISLLISRS